MTYDKAINTLYRQTPAYERQGRSGYKDGLDNTLAIDEHYGHPHTHYQTIHIAGTNGKGSCAHSIAAALQQCGHTTGLYTSPHIADFRERIRVDGVPVNKDYVARFVEDALPLIARLHPSFFELTTAMAFKYFMDRHVRCAVIEVGLGGRLDCTNIITPILSVITNISLDHTQLLGNTVTQIAQEKAGIIKPGVPVVIGEATPETRPVFTHKAHEAHARIVFAEDTDELREVTEQTPTHTTQHLVRDTTRRTDPRLTTPPRAARNDTRAANAHDNPITVYSTRTFGEIRSPLNGTCQHKNMLTVLTALKETARADSSLIDLNNPRTASHIRDALRNVTTLTGLAGRWQTIRTHPTVICDAGHNPAAWRYTARNIAALHCPNIHIIIGMVRDKDTDAILSTLPTNAVYYFTRPDTPRALDEHALQTAAERHGLSGHAFHSVTQALNTALQHAHTDDTILVAGSFYLLADVLQKGV